MQNTHSSTQLIGRAALVALLAAPALGAQDNGRWEDRDYPASQHRQRDEMRRLFTWHGSVENDTRIYVRGNDVQARTVSGTNARGRGARGNVDADRALPRREGMVRVQLVEGRGRVYVVQQPNAGNDYTAILRVMDSQRGSARYRFVVYFDPRDEGRRVDRSTVWGDVGGDVDVRGASRVLRWSGDVDGDLRISLWRGQLSYNEVSGQRPQNVRSAVGDQVPRRDGGYVSVSLRQGRGTVSVIEQPSAYNNYTAVVRVLDGQRGYGYYDFDLIWR
jgi:hypothetical protein